MESRACLEHLLGAQIHGHPVTDLLGKGDSTAASLLAHAGLRLLPDGALALATAPQLVAPLFGTSRWQDGCHCATLIGCEGALHGRNMRFHGRVSKTILLPATLIHQAAFATTALR